MMLHVVPGPSKIYTAQEHATATVYLDGQDVSDQCTEACPGEGWVTMLVRDEQGHYVLEENEIDIVTKRVYGAVHVEIIV